MSINWKVRVKNPTWWAQVGCAVVLPLIVGTGAQWSDMTSWQTLGQTLLAALMNPVVVVAMLVQLWTAIESQDSHDEPDFEPRGGGNGDD